MLKQIGKAVYDIVKSRNEVHWPTKTPLFFGIVWTTGLRRHLWLMGYISRTNEFIQAASWLRSGFES